MKSGYRGLVIALVVLIILSNLSEGFIEPIAFVLKTETNGPQNTIIKDYDPRSINRKIKTQRD